MPLQLIRVWDLPTRLFHWLLATAVAVAWLSGDEPRHSGLHLFAGYLVLALLVWRLLWGVVGGRYSRLSALLRPWSEVREHLASLGRDAERPPVGHNPAAGWAMLLLMGLLLALGISGLLVLGAEEVAGPLAGWAPVATGIAWHGIHDALAWGLLALVGLHVTAAVVEGRREGQNLVAGMIHGRKLGRPEQAEGRGRAGMALLMALASLLWALWWFAPTAREADATQGQAAPVGPQLAQDRLWQQSCSECHLAFHPSLLPDRSWRALLAGQDDHFGEGLYLEPETIVALQAFATANAAEQGASEAAWRINASLTDDVVPLQITDTPHWRELHRELSESLWERPGIAGRFDCAACHRDAEAATFNNGAIRIPDAPDGE